MSQYIFEKEFLIRAQRTLIFQFSRFWLLNLNVGRRGGIEGELRLNSPLSSE